MKKKNKLWNLLLMIGLALMLTSSCSKSDDTNNPTPNGAITDIDGNVYHSATIGTQVWMVENLKTTKYRNGDPIPNVTGDVAWTALATGAYCWYNNDATTNKATYGALYNWYAVNDNRKIAPTGWHIPTDDEWTTLTTFLGGLSVASGKLKETGTSHWLSPNAGATNESGFSALPGGARSGGSGNFYNISYAANFWSSWGGAMYQAFYRNLSYNNSSDFNSSSSNIANGFSVRCIRD